LNIKGFITSVFIDRDVSGRKKTSDTLEGVWFVEFTHHFKLSRFKEECAGVDPALILEGCSV